MHDDLLLVGSIPMETVEQVFEAFGGPLGEHLCAMPDGEVGPRTHWISRVHYQVFAGHPDLEILRRPAPDDGVERLNPRNAGDSWLFKVKDGVDIVRFGTLGWRLGYARDAINSYFAFKTLREKGVLAKHLRFQVSMPMVNSVVPPRVFPTPGDVDKVRPGYEEALTAELKTIVDHIPAEDLAIQWDCATELQDVYGAIEALPAEGRIERNVGQIRRVSAVLPEEALLGVHLCFGTLGGWPRFQPDDLGGAVDFANGIVAGAGRRVDWLHIPALDRDDEDFYAPLARLRPNGTKIYLGMVHHMESYPKRLATARKFLAEFGVGAYCGFGRHAPSELPQVLEEQLKAVAQL